MYKVPGRCRILYGSEQAQGKERERKGEDHVLELTPKTHFHHEILYTVPVTILMCIYRCGCGPNVAQCESGG